MLILKLTMVPLALLLLGIAERLHGPRVAGWLSGFPVVAAPLLLFVTLDQGERFGSAAALGAYFGLLPWLAFTMSYAYVARRWGWLASAVCGFSAWTVAAYIALYLQSGPAWLEILPACAFLGAISFYPRGEASDEERDHAWWGLPSRMLAGALLTVLITKFAGVMGTRWSGIFTTFPVMGSIIAISSHIQYGRHAVQEAVAGMTMGLASVGAFCFAAYQLLGPLPVWPALGLSLLASTAALGMTFLLFKHKNGPG